MALMQTFRHNRAPWIISPENLVVPALSAANNIVQLADSSRQIVPYLRSAYNYARENLSLEPLRSARISNAVRAHRNNNMRRRATRRSFNRRSRRPRRSFRRRRPVRSRRGKRAPYGTSTRLIPRRARLNLNFKRNDFDSYRARHTMDALIAGDDTAHWVKKTFNLTHFPLVNSVINNYDYYKITNIQYRIIPLNGNWARLASSFGIASTEDMEKMVIFNRAHLNTQYPLTTVPTQDQLLQSVQGMKYSLRRSRPIVVNSAAYSDNIRSIIDVNGATVNTHESPKPLGWIENLGALGAEPLSTNYPNVGGIQIYLPKLATGNTLNFNVEVYATILFRGNRNLLTL